MKYNNIDEIRVKFGIEETEVGKLVKLLEKIRNELHPDKNGGEFKDEKEKLRYHDAIDALNFIESNTQEQSLIKISEVTAIIKSIKDLIPSQKHETNEKRLSESINYNISHIKEKFRIPKIALSASTAILSFLFLFPNQIKEHPILSKYIDINSPNFALLWFFLLFYTIIFWIVAYLRTKVKRNDNPLKNKFFSKFNF